MTMKIAAAIPTRNRPEDLGKAVASVRTQVRPPDELIIVDQSPSNESRELIASMMADDISSCLIYIHDPKISGLVDAKRVAAERSSGDIVCFLEDDVIMEPDYLLQIEQGFAEHAEMLGCCGIVTNPPCQPFGYEWAFHLFHRGIYRDIRVGIYGRIMGAGHELIQSDVLSGGLSAWRREVFAAVPFDVANGFFMLEDMDFSTRAARRFGHQLYINPNARLEHHWSPVNREVLAPRQRRKLTEFIAYYKKRRDWPGARVALGWLLVGLLIEAGVQCLSARSVAPLKGYFAGLRDGLAKRIV